MKRKEIKTVTAIISMVMCLILVFNSSALAVNSQKESLTLEDISIIRQCGVLEGESIQLQATLSPSDAPLSGVEWSSSNPSVIECDKNGRIKGIQAGGYANITCKSKWNNNISDTIKVYCVKPLAQPIKSGFKNFFVSIYGQPSTAEPISTYFNLLSFYDIILEGLKVLLGMGAVLPLSANNTLSIFTTGKCTVYGQSGKWCYVRFNDTVSSDGFVQYTTLKKEIPSFLYLNKDRIIVYSDRVHRDDAILKAEYNGNVTWTVSDDTKIDFNRTTGQITGNSPGVVTITAKTADGMSQKCKVISVYKWPQSWNVTPSTDIQFYVAPYTLNKSVVQKTDKSFHVVGDMGDNSNWCLVNNGSESSPSYHFAKIDDFSTKGTISQYNNLNWQWPVTDVKNGIIQSVKPRYITSPYGWRDDEPIKHKGIDITNGISSKKDFENSVDGYEVVSAFAGTVIYVYDYTLGYKSCGNCVAIQSNEKDPITGKYYVAIYMHLKFKPSVRENQKISANTLLGYAGDTGNSGGSHLHFEVNNQNLSYGQKLYYDEAKKHEKVFSIVINPIFFYMNYYNLPNDNSDKITINPGCSAMSYRKPLWYGDDIKETKEP
ncbi:MAG: peptidoglycan DD-metalloendopeptidase family protein [Clostridia bacterium]|nr:peptidoglycan DD-metalloendopeptidase family protein [Clostridia bacterium]